MQCFLEFLNLLCAFYCDISPLTNDSDIGHSIDPITRLFPNEILRVT